MARRCQFAEWLPGVLGMAVTTTSLRRGLEGSRFSRSVRENPGSNDPMPRTKHLYLVGAKDATGVQILKASQVARAPHSPLSNCLARTALGMKRPVLVASCFKTN